MNQENKTFKKQIREQTLGYMVTALGLVAGLAWNDAIRALIDYFFPLPTNGISAKFLYAIVVTIIVVIITSYLVGLMRDKEEI